MTLEELLSKLDEAVAKGADLNQEIVVNVESEGIVRSLVNVAFEPGDASVELSTEF